ncbi:MAG: dihydrodipicolinate synthase family protein [Verrucomicrobiales bacterium]|nr:dihydrodipicolinate synthase family protein [Verrucomicrobiales bacterium]MCP5527010.1 dihydrodipicolinate synthase family protein [Verrucomicrobiales bacterium]
MKLADIPPLLRRRVLEGMVIPAHPLALTADRRLDERRQRALTRYYLEAGAGGVAVGVHTTQFAIRKPNVGLLEPVLTLAAETVDDWEHRRAAPAEPTTAPTTGKAVDRASREVRGAGPILKVAGLCGDTAQAIREARLALDRGYHAGLLSLSALRAATVDALVDHCREVASGIPVVGFYLQPAVGGRVLPHAFWRRFVEIENVLAIKIAPFNRYQTLDVVRAVAAAGRQNEIALYTGNDDQIVLDLLTPFRFGEDPASPSGQIVGGLLGHWAVWTQGAVALLDDIRERRRNASPIDPAWLTRAARITDVNAALFDAANGFRGCIAGIHEVLRRQGLLEGIWCLDPAEGLSPGQAREIDRVCRAYPSFNDDAFVAEHLDEWMRD